MVGSLGWWTKATKGGHADTIGPEKKKKKKLDNTVTAGCGGGDDDDEKEKKGAMRYARYIAAIRVFCMPPDTPSYGEGGGALATSVTNFFACVKMGAI